MAFNIENVFKVTFDTVLFQNRFEPINLDDVLIGSEGAKNFTRDPIHGEFCYKDEFKVLVDKFKRADNKIVE